MTGTPWLLILLTTTQLPVAIDPAEVPSPEETAQRMHLPDGYRVFVFASEPTLANPLAIDFDNQGRAYVLEARQYPVKADGPRGADRILILEDTDGDHRADRVQVFADGLNLASGIAVGYGGVFVGQAPYLLFLRDRDGDGRADEQVVLLEGWPFEDTHETLNSFAWGPDGWLYGTHGIMHEANVRGQRFNAAVWRYHPRTKKFEVVAEGTNNPWGLEYAPNGDWFISTSVIPHLYLIVPGAFHRHGQVRWWSNPYAYGEVPTVVDHRHFPPSYSGWEFVLRWNKASVPKVPAGVDPVSFFGGGHAHSGLALTFGTPVPAPYQDSALVGNLHGNRLNSDRLIPYRSIYVATHGPDFLRCDDPYFRPVHLKWGPDGALYVLDWYDRQICHTTDERVWDKKLGRIYKIVPPAGVGPKPVSSVDWFDRLRSPYRPQWQRALQEAAERPEIADGDQLKQLLIEGTEPVAVRALWALYVTQRLTPKLLLAALTDDREDVCRAAVRLLAEPDHRGQVGRFRPQLLRLAAHPSARVRLALASSAIAWEDAATREAVLHRLMLEDQDADDPAIPAVLWTAYEKEAMERADVRAKWLIAHGKRAVVKQHILPWFVRRLADEQQPDKVALALELLGELPDSDAARRALEELLAALRQEWPQLKHDWDKAAVHLRRLAKSAELGLLVDRAGVYFADLGAVERLLQAARRPELPVEQRAVAARALGWSSLPQARRGIVQLVTDPTVDEAVREAAIDGLRRGITQAQARWLVEHWSDVPASLKRDVLLVLVTSRVGAEALVDGLERGWVPRSDVPEGAVRRIMMLADKALMDRLRRSWGALHAMTAPEARAELARLGRALAQLPGDRQRGQQLFTQHCAPCHRYRGQGQAVGPDLEGAGVRDPFYLLYNIVDPNRVVGAAYYTAVVVDRDGRVHQGLLRQRGPKGVVLVQEEGKRLELPAEAIEEIRVVEQSLMPSDLSRRFDEQAFADLVAYIMGDLYLNRGYVYGPVVADNPLDHRHPIERAERPLDVDRKHWKPFQYGPGGRLTLSLAGIDQHERPPEAAYYVYVVVESPSDRPARLWLDARKAARVWLNGEEVFRGERLRVPVEVPVPLKRGRNEFLIKLANIVRLPNAPAAAGECSIRAWLTDPEQVLRLVVPGQGGGEESLQ